MDEIFTLRGAHVGGHLGVSDLLEDLHGPFYSLLLHAWTSWAGASEWALRLPSALLGVALVGAVAWLAGRWAGRQAIAPAAWLAAGSPFLVWYAQEARNYTLLMLCAALATGLALGWAAGPRWRVLAGYLVSAWVGLMSNLGFALLGPFHGYVLLGRRSGGARRALMASAGVLVFVLLLLPWVPQLRSTLAWERLRPAASAASRAEVLRAGPPFHAAAVPYAFYAFSAGYSLGPSVRELHRAPRMATVLRHAPELAAAALAFGVLAVAGALALARRRRLLDAALWLVVPAAGLSYLAVCNFKPFNARYLAACVPGYLALLAAGWSVLGPRTRRAVGTLVVVLWGVSLYQHYFVPDYGKEDFRAVAAWLRAHGSPGEVVVAAGADEPLFHYYAGPLPVVHYWLGWVDDPARLRGKFAALAGERERAWVVLSRPEALDPQDRFAAWIARAFPGAERREWTGVTVWHLSRPDSGWDPGP